MYRQKLPTDRSNNEQIWQSHGPQLSPGSLAAQLSSGRLLTWQGDVHTAYNRGNRCVDDAVERYLLSGTLPAEGTRCR